MAESCLPVVATQFLHKTVPDIKLSLSLRKHRQVCFTARQITSRFAQTFTPHGK